MKVALLILGIVALVAGFFVAFAGGMSDNPQLGDSYGRAGCAIAVLGSIAIVASIAWMALR